MDHESSAALWWLTSDLMYKPFVKIPRVYKHDYGNFLIYVWPPLNFLFYSIYRYYLQVPVILEKLPREYPISAYAVKLISGVMSAVLQRDVKMRHI